MNIIQDSCLEIRDNKLSYEKSFIQLSNISQASVQKEVKHSYSFLAMLGVVVGIALICMYTNFPWIGLGILAISILLLLPTFIINRKKKYILILVTNSGNRVAFRCKQEAFLVEILEIIKNKISNTDNYSINLEDCTITNSQIGKENVMNSN